MNENESSKTIQSLHDQACANGQDTYIDPVTGFTVFTSHYHKKRGFCCQSGCRHCPYGFKVEKKGSSLFKPLSCRKE